MTNNTLLTGDARDAYIAARFGKPETISDPGPGMAEFDPRDAMTSIGDGPAIYMGFWGLYNDANLYGNWIKLEEANTAERINQCIDFLRQNFSNPQDHNLEEWMVQDHQNLPRCLHGENPDLDKVEEFMTALEDVGADNIEPYLMACDNQHQVIDADDFRDCFYGIYESEEDFCQQFYEDMGTDLGPLASHVDWSSVWRDFTFDTWYSERLSSGDVAIFSS
jgi:antirestriction protein